MHILIIGNGIAGITCALEARVRDATARITVVSGETEFFYSRTALMYAFMDKMDRRDLEPYERDVWAKQRIDLVADWLVDVDATKHTARLEKAGNITYDKLVLAVGASARIPEWQGSARAAQGVVNFVSMQDLDACEGLVPSTRRAVVAGGGLIGIELVECLRHHRIPTTFLIREPFYWPAALSREESELVIAHLREHGVDVVLDDVIAEVVSESGRVKSVRTTLGKSYDCDLLGVCIGVTANVSRLATWTTRPELGRGILVDDGFRTSLPDVYACGDCCEVRRADGTSFTELIWYSAKRHGQLTARSIFGDDVHYEQPVFFNSSKFFHIEFTTVGDVETAQAGTPTIYRHRRGQNVTQRIVHDGKRVIGFNMLGSRWDNELLARWITERRSAAWVLEHLAEAQHDVEFGRVDLSRFVETSLPLAKLGSP